ncbi:MAG: peptidylprolyl isomerase [Pirellulaceae bacterium]|nr:peptidylprolyl isomerase [Pirellulaceae bacterium]
MPIYANRLPSLLRLSLTLLAGACLALPTSLAQENPANSQKGSPESADSTAKSNKAPDDPAYQAVRTEFLDHLKLMREAQVRYHLSEDSSRDKKFRREWAELCDRGRPLAAKAYAAMLKKFNDNPSANTELGKFLLELLHRNVSDSRFEGMLELALALEAAGVTGEKVAEGIALSAVAENKFELAKPWIEKHYKESEKPRPVLAPVYDNIPALTSDWAEELRLREEDAKGEPLPQVSILTTKGEVIVELFENQAPETVANFIHLVEQGFYDGLSFHRVLEHFMAQTGCPFGDGTGGPEYSIYGEAQKQNARKYFRGTLGMALSNGDANSGGSQFFICYMPAQNLNGQYTAFGRVVKGIEVIGNLAKVNPDEKKKEDAAPVVLDEIIEAKVVRKRNHEYKPNKVQGRPSSTPAPK